MDEEAWSAGIYAEAGVGGEALSFDIVCFFVAFYSKFLCVYTRQCCFLPTIKKEHSVLAIFLSVFVFHDPYLAGRDWRHILVEGKKLNLLLSFRMHIIGSLRR